jgi:hypothetical protein
VGLLPRVVFANILGDRLIVAGLDVDASGRPVSVVGMTGLLGASQEITRLETFDGAVRIGGLSSRDKLVYFTKTGRHRDGAVLRVGLDGSPATVIAQDQFEPASVAAVPNGVVWINERGGDAELLFAALP